MANLVAEFIADAGLTQSELSSRSGVPKATLHRWMTGKSTRPYHRAGLLKIALALDLRKSQVNRLLRAAGHPSLDMLASRADSEEATLTARWTRSVRNNLPADLTSFIGREVEIDRVEQLVTRPDVRLLTLTGTGGSGKTRLALQVAREVLDGFRDGVFWVPLGSVFRGDLVIQQVANAIDLYDVGDSTLLTRLTNWLRTRRVLLVLDNLEQILDCGTVIAGLLKDAAELTVLSTSRVPLRLFGEHEFPVYPLPVEPSTQPVDALRGSPAISLFVERAESANSRQSLEDRHLTTIAEICARLDGLPLAIELAATRMRDRNPQELMTDFPARLDLAGEGPQDVPRRQQTLRDTIAWSVDLLRETERTLFAKLSVFVAGWTEDAAETVCLDTSSTAESFHELLGALVNANLIERFESSNGAARYRTLETIREFGLELLDETGDDSPLRERHARYFLGVAEWAPPYIPETRAGDWFERVDAELDNIRVALDWAASQADPTVLARFCVALWPYWHEYLRTGEGRRWLNLILPGRDELPDKLRAGVLSGSCALAAAQTEYEKSNTYATEGLELWGCLDDHREQAIIFRQLGWNSYMMGSPALSIGLYESALREWRLADEPHGIARGLNDVGFTHLALGDLETATPYFIEAEAMYHAIHDEAGLARLTRDQGLLAMLRGDLQTAIRLLRESMTGLTVLGNTYLAPGTSFFLGTALCWCGDLAGATACYIDALGTQELIGDKANLSLTILGFAAVAHRRGNVNGAAVLCGASHAIRQANNSALPPAVQAIYQREVDLVIEQIGLDTFQQAFAHGAEMTMLEAIDYAREIGIPE